MTETAEHYTEIATADRLQAQATAARLRGDIDAALRYDERAAHCRRRHIGGPR